MHPVIIALIIILIFSFSILAMIGVSKIYNYIDEKTIRISMDTIDDEAFSKVLHALRIPGLLGMQYDCTTDIMFMIITVRKASYSRYMTELKQIPRVEVI